MTREDRELLIKDLCARLPYGVKCIVTDSRTEEGQEGDVGKITHVCLEGVDCIDDYGNYPFFSEFGNFKPYLFPLSSMTEEQKREYNKWKHQIPVCHYEYGDVVEEIELYDSPESFEYLIENHFDYRGLIKKGLAIDATDKNIY